MRRPLALMLLGMLIYLANAVLLQWGIELRLFRAGVVWTTPLMVMGPAVFYALARSGWSGWPARLRDPSMVMAQGLYCALLTVVIYIYTFAHQEVGLHLVHPAIDHHVRAVQPQWPAVRCLHRMHDGGALRGHAFAPSS